MTVSTRSVLGVAAVLAILALTGGALAIYAARARSAASSAPAGPSPLAELDGAVRRPAEDDFPVLVEGQRLLGAYAPGSGVAFAVLSHLRSQRFGGVVPAPPGEDILALRLGAATDSEVPVDPNHFTFSLTDVDGRRYEPVTIVNSGRLLPGPELNVVDVYFSVPVTNRPRSVTITANERSLILPACPVPSATQPIEDPESQESAA